MRRRRFRRGRVRMRGRRRFSRGRRRFSARRRSPMRMRIGFRM